MARFCREVPGPKLANMLEEGRTPVLPPARLEEIGYTIAAYPLTLLNASIQAMQESLRELQAGRQPRDLLSFAELQKVVGFPAYDREAARYAPAPGKIEDDGER